MTNMMRNSSIVLAVLLTINCASSPRKIAIDFNQTIVIGLQTAATIADEAYIAKSITPEKRIEFSKNYLVPAYTLTKELAECLQKNLPNCGFVNLTDLTFKVAGSFVESLPDSPFKVKLFAQIKFIMVTLDNWLAYQKEVQ